MVSAGQSIQQPIAGFQVRYAQGFTPELPPSQFHG